MAGGRPRTSCPEYDDLIELGKKLVEWSSDEDPNKLRWCDWYTELGFIKVQWDKMLEKPEFRAYYERAQKNLARKWLNGTVNSSIAHRFLWLYCPDLKASEIEKMEIEANIKKTKDESEAHNIADAINNLVDSKKEEKDEL